MNLEAMVFRRDELKAEIANKQQEVEKLTRQIALASAERAIDRMPRWQQLALQSAFNTSGTNPTPRTPVMNEQNDCY